MSWQASPVRCSVRKSADSGAEKSQKSVLLGVVKKKVPKPPKKPVVARPKKLNCPHCSEQFSDRDMLDFHVFKHNQGMKGS